MDTYKVKIHCTNCGYNSFRDKEKGRMIKSDLERGFTVDECPNCGCDSIIEQKNL